MNKQKQQQVCAFRELVLAHHAYERALAEFAKVAQVPTNRTTRGLAYEVCSEMNPRAVSADDAEFAIKCVQEG